MNNIFQTCCCCSQYASAAADQTVRIWNAWRHVPRRKKLSKMKGASAMDMASLGGTESTKDVAETADDLESEEETVE